MPRIAAIVEYDGSVFHGFQLQPPDHGLTVQAALEQAISQIAAEQIRVHCAGRTDKLVHATKQVIHFDCLAQRPEQAWLKGVNTLLPRGVRIVWAGEVAQDFHARFSAMRRRYIYLLVDQSEPLAIARNHLATERRALDTNAMQSAADLLLGEHDFSSFRAAGCQASSPVRYLERFTVRDHGSMICFDVQANAFLQHMVRNLVGTLTMVGRAEKPVEWVTQVLLARDRRLAGVTAPAQGLYLVDVVYPQEFALPCGANYPWMMQPV